MGGGAACGRPTDTTMRLLVVIALSASLWGCSDSGDGLTPAERAKRAPKMSDEVWKVYSGTESGVSDAKKDEQREQK